MKLVRPTLKMEKAALAFRQEFFCANERIINGSERFDMIEDYKEWLSYITDNAVQQTVHIDWSWADVWFACYEGEIVGIIDLRKELKPFMQFCGNCGYSVRPSKRNRGFATKMLQLLCAEAQKVGMNELLLSVEKNNQKSKKAIIKNNGRWVKTLFYNNKMIENWTIQL